MQNKMWNPYSKRCLLFLPTAIWLFVGVTWSKSEERQSNPQFLDISKDSGLAVSHRSTAEKSLVLDTISGGVGFIDCDSDGRLDILMANGSTLDQFKKNGGGAMVTLFRQTRELRFEDVTQQSGLTRTGWGFGVAVADFDNDGLPDIYVTGFGHNVLYRNKGNCSFEDVTDRAGVVAEGFSTGAAWADYDRDGNVDLVVSRYVKLDLNRLPQAGSDPKFCHYGGAPVHCGPQGLLGETLLLFHNRGNGTFEDVSARSGLTTPGRQYGLGTIWTDYDNDGWPDLFVANDAGSNYLFRNTHDGKFVETAMTEGVALGPDGQIQGSMGADWGDFDNDGRFDLVVTEFAHQSARLYHNLGTQGFADVADQSQIAMTTLPYVGWGVAFLDTNNVGWQDIVIANGHVYPQADSIASEKGYQEPLFLFRNQRNGHFEDVTATEFPTLRLASRRGLAIGDINNDGCLDILTMNIDSTPTLLLNKCSPRNHYFVATLIGTKSNKMAIGARVEIKSDGLFQMREVRGGGGYLSQMDTRVHFGLGPRTEADQVTVRWPSGHEDVFHNLNLDRLYVITEGVGIQ